MGDEGLRRRGWLIYMYKVAVPTIKEVRAVAMQRSQASQGQVLNRDDKGGEGGCQIEVADS